ncbi:hypothetical protein BpHYR1_033232 [Brachionus plicatilis]|uniref:Uncharacterized protein n=1 Tax=Brachionus plicatilis TaxID=10195 RepID=A0A3M7QUK8_BRAPC|nr:hypothetical protein BpHYR1_033232 [Brachionus plicatilis]
MIKKIQLNFLFLKKNDKTFGIDAKKYLRYIIINIKKIKNLSFLNFDSETNTNTNTGNINDQINYQYFNWLNIFVFFSLFSNIKRLSFLSLAQLKINKMLLWCDYFFITQFDCD